MTLKGLKLTGFISRLLGMGDIKSLIEKAEEALGEEDFDMESMLRGKVHSERYVQNSLKVSTRWGPMKQNYADAASWRNGLPRYRKIAYQVNG